jgi:hypothetical protein
MGRAFAFIRWSGAPVKVETPSVSTPRITSGGVNLPLVGTVGKFDIGSATIIPSTKPIDVTLGHVAWAFEEQKDIFICGSLENIAGLPIRSGDNHGAYWTKRTFGGVSGMLREMKTCSEANAKLKPSPALPGYNAWKQFYVDLSTPELAKAEARKWGDLYLVAGANCLDNTIKVLEAFGVKNLPWAITNWTPKGWFRSINNAGQSGNL